MHIHTSLVLFTLSLALAQKDFPDLPDLSDSLDSLTDSLDDVSGLESPNFKSIALMPLPYNFCSSSDRQCTDGTNSGCCSDGICCGSGCASDGWACVITAGDREDPKICSGAADDCYDVVAEIKEEDGKTVTSTLKDAPTGTARSTPTLIENDVIIGEDDLDNSDSSVVGDTPRSDGERLGAGLWMVGAAAGAGLVLLGAM